MSHSDEGWIAQDIRQRKQTLSSCPSIDVVVLWLGKRAIELFRHQCLTEAQISFSIKHSESKKLVGIVFKCTTIEIKLQIEWPVYFRIRQPLIIKDKQEKKGPNEYEDLRQKRESEERWTTQTRKISFELTTNHKCHQSKVILTFQSHASTFVDSGRRRV